MIDLRRPMKGAAVEDLTLIRLPCFAFPKIDGFRCILANEPLTSRLSPFPNRFFAKKMSGFFNEIGALLDSEVVVGKNRGPGVLQRTSSGLTSEAGKPDFTLWVFDTVLHDTPFESRAIFTRRILQDLHHPQVRYLTPKWIADYEELVAYLDYCLNKGYEGIITRSPDGIYKQGKSTLREQGMLKVKPFEDAEGRVIGWYEEMENTNEATREITGKLKRSSAKSGKVAKGRLGGLILEDVKSGVQVRVGGGFDGIQRDRLWPIVETLRGKLVKYKKQSVGEKDKPRHPNFVEFIDFRPSWDFSD